MIFSPLNLRKCDPVESLCVVFGTGVLLGYKFKKNHKFEGPSRGIALRRPGPSAGRDHQPAVRVRLRGDCQRGAGLYFFSFFCWFIL
jgi:hypothetical protein